MPRGVGGWWLGRRANEEDFGFRGTSGSPAAWAEQEADEEGLGLRGTPGSPAAGD